jgi:small subunit ribosomal protein S20
MPNTKSAERRMRGSARKHLRNNSIKSRLKTLEKTYLELVESGKKDQAASTFREVSSAFDKAAKAVEEYVKDNEAARKELGRISNAVVGGGKLSDYGTVPAQDYLRKWAKEYGQKPEREPKPDVKKP